MEYARNKIQTKLQLEKDRIDDMNAQLIEESADIDQHVQMFRSEMISNKVDEEKYKQMDEYRKKLKEQRAANNQKVEDQKE